MKDAQDSRNDSTKNQGDLRELRDQGDMRDVTGQSGNKNPTN
jgi:hypothetical protein